MSPSWARVFLYVVVDAIYRVMFISLFPLFFIFTWFSIGRDKLRPKRARVKA